MCCVVLMVARMLKWVGVEKKAMKIEIYIVKLMNFLPFISL